MGAAQLEATEARRVAAEERAAFVQQIAALEGENAQLAESAAENRLVLENASMSAWRAMESLNQTLRDLCVRVPDTTHRPEALSETLGLIEEGAGVALHGARTFGEHCSYVGACFALALLHIRGCRHTHELANPQLDPPGRAEVMSDAIRSIGPSLQNFHQRIWGRFGEGAARVAVQQTLHGEGDLLQWLERALPRRRRHGLVRTAPRLSGWPGRAGG